MTSPDLYFDFNGSTPVDASVLAAAAPYLSGEFANPSANHVAGQRARAAIDAARVRIAESIGAHAEEIRFTSGGTESNNWALFGSMPREARVHVLVSAIEHKSVLSTADELERQGHVVTRVAPDSSGAVRVADVERALRADTALVSVMWANNETGVLQPVREIGELCRARNVRFHSDAVCAYGKVAVDVASSPCDLLSLASHKVYAPKGLGVLFVRRGTALRPFMWGCGQQDGLRGGTENPFTVVALARAAEIIQRERATGAVRLEILREELWRGIRERCAGASRNGSGATLPNTLNVRFPGRLGADLQRELSALGISVSVGAASIDATPSHVLIAMGLAPAAARESVRFSLGATTTRESVTALLAALEAVSISHPSSRMEYSS
ncbi:MAG: cysteine desulfurase family protein [Planctomycetota bacterium]|nr:cysteine desulfurase family protein [Planctomycetota bacterium]